MISPRCGRCSRELAEPGALIFTPPEPGPANYRPSYDRTLKYHVCVTCFDAVMRVIREPDDSRLFLGEG